jgi:hypothetical protein
MERSAELVKVGYAGNRTEGEMIQSLLKNEGIPSLMQALGVNGPQLGFGTLPNDPQRILVRASQAERARALLADTPAAVGQEALPEPLDVDSPENTGGRKPRSYGLVGGYARIYLWSFGITALAFGIFLLLHGG